MEEETPVDNLETFGVPEEALQESNGIGIEPPDAEECSREGRADLNSGVEPVWREDTCSSCVSDLPDEKINGMSVYSEVLGLIRSTKEVFRRILDSLNEDKSGNLVGGDASLQDDPVVILSEAGEAHKLGLEVESRFIVYEDMRIKEKRKLESSIRSLTEENRDINGLLTAAVLEKEAADKALGKLKLSGEQKKMAIFQIAEWGLQKAGFGFVMGAPTGESNDNSSNCDASITSEGSEREENGGSLASTVEKTIRNLRQEITELQCSLEECRLDNEHLQGLTCRQSQEITDSALYIKVLEEKETIMTQKIEDLALELRGAEEEVVRWRKACELEVQAGKAAIKECKREIASLQADLQRTRTAVDMLTKKLKLKEKLAATAMTAQAAAETSLRLADSRSVSLRERIEELTKQLEEEFERGRKEQSSVRRKIRHMCWPWQGLMPTPSVPSTMNARRSTLHMMALLQ